jgi:hypothetical protein
VIDGSELAFAEPLSFGPGDMPTHYQQEQSMKSQSKKEQEYTNPEYDRLASEVVAIVREHGETAMEEDRHSIKFARMLSVAPETFFAALDERVPGAAAEHRAWAASRIERADYAEFFLLLKQVGDIERELGEGASHRPEYAGLFVRLIQTAPPRYRAEAELILAPCVPTATHVSNDGQTVYSLDQLADHLGVPVDELRKFADAHFDHDEVYCGTAHQLH